MITAADILHGKILIVDDKNANILLLMKVLGRAGYDSITSTVDPCEVCALHSANHYDLILLDLQMPGLDGFQVMENLKEIEQGGYLPVLVITARPEHRVRALKAGAKDFIGKPWDLDEVLIRVHNMLEVRLMHKETRKLYARVLAEKQVLEQKLRNMMSNSGAEALKTHTEILADGSAELIADSYAKLTALFEDIMQFTKSFEAVSAEARAGALNSFDSDR